MYPTNIIAWRICKLNIRQLQKYVEFFNYKRNTIIYFCVNFNFIITIKSHYSIATSDRNCSPMDLTKIKIGQIHHVCTWANISPILFKIVNKD